MSQVSISAAVIARISSANKWHVMTTADLGGKWGAEPSKKLTYILDEELYQDIMKLGGFNDTRLQELCPMADAILGVSSPDGFEELWKLGLAPRSHAFVLKSVPLSVVQTVAPKQLIIYSLRRDVYDGLVPHEAGIVAPATAA